MKLRIVAGSLRGRILQCPAQQLPFRPTLERTRTSIADMLQPRVSGCAAADLCAGSGSFGFEMLSRGAARVDFVENDLRCAALLRGYAEKFGVSDQCRIVVQDVADFVRTSKGRYDIIFFDPPYGAEGMQALVPSIRLMLSPQGILLYQRSRRGWTEEESNAPPFETRKFGDTIVECYNVRNE